jgi:membrane protease YdiL (CAAX protease family)
LERGAANWRPWTAWVALVSGFGATFVAGVFVAIIVVATSGAPKTEDFSPGVNVGMTLFQNAALLGAAFLFARISGGRPTAGDFGLVKPRPVQAIVLLVAVWLSFYVISGIWALALRLDEKHELPDRLGAGDSLASTLLVVFLITIVAPLGEELFFRGYFFRALKNWRGVVPAALLTGGVFGAIHLGSSPAAFTVPLAVFGIGLCLLYHWTGSLYPSIALHALNNSVALGVALQWSWEVPVTMVGSVAATLTIAWSIGRLLGQHRSAPRPVAVA